jgi:acetyl esterase/lipase
MRARSDERRLDGGSRPSCSLEGPKGRRRAARAAAWLDVLLLALVMLAAPLLQPAWADIEDLTGSAAPAAQSLSPSLKDLRISRDPFLGIRTYRLWPGLAPGATSDEEDQTPTLTLFRPLNPNGTAVIIAPGGAYLGLAAVAEGRQVADWFAARGVTALVLRYRVGAKGMLPLPLYDAERAMRLVRAHAAELEIDPNRIGMIGFSAGGHLAAYTAANARRGDPQAADPLERVSSRPDFLVLAYPWINATTPFGNGASPYCASRGTPCVPGKYVQYEPLPRIGADFPPTFIFHTADDAAVPVEDSLQLFAALRRNKVPVELHIFETGAHGAALGAGDPALSHWPLLLDQWLRSRNLLSTARPAG